MKNLTIVLSYFNNDTLYTATVDYEKHSIEATKKAVAKRVWEALVESTGATPENYKDFDKIKKDFIKTRAKQVQENLPETVERWLEAQRKTLSFKGTVEVAPVAKRSKKTYSINIYRYNRELNSSEFFAYEMEKYTTKVEALKSLPLFVRKDETTGSYYVTEATTGLKVADARKKKDLELDLQRLADRFTLDELMQKLQESIEKNGCANPEYSGVAPEKEEAPVVEAEKEEAPVVEAEKEEAPVVEAEKETVVVESIYETTYDDESMWVYYTAGQKYGYAIVEDAEDMSWKEKALEKLSIHECSKELQRLIIDCEQSENEMWFIEEDDEDYNEQLVEKLEKEVCELGLENYFEFNNGDTKITVFGGVITELLFGEAPAPKKEEVVFNPENTAIDTRNAKSAELVAEIATPASKILDYGCGTGRNIKYLKNNCDAQVVDGTDIAEQLKKEAEKHQQLIDDRTTIATSDELDKDYDLILNSHVLNVIESDSVKEMVLADMFEKLSDNGKAVIEVRTKSDVEGAKTKEPYGDGWKIKKGNGFTYQEAITKEKMQALLSKAGFKIEEHIYNSSRHIVTVAK